MESVAATVEDRIRERAYHLWESSGRPIGRDEEFWLQACEVIAADAEKAPRMRRRKRPSPATSG
jgi:hypothetical protein